MTYQTTHSPLRKRVIKALGWSIGGQVISYSLRLGNTLIMTRLLDPESYGLVALVTVVMVIVSLMADVGLRQSITRSTRGDDIEFLDTAFSVQVIRGGILTIVIIAVAASLAGLGRGGVLGDKSTFAHPLLPWLVGTSALSSLILGFQSMNLFRVDRHLRGDLTVRVELAVQVITMLATVAIAILTRSVWAVVIGGLVGNVCHVLLTRYWLPGHRDRFRWEGKAVAELLSFGRWIMVSSALTGLTMNGDRLLLGGAISAENLGLYAIALNLIGLASGTVSRITGTVSLQAISEVYRSAPERAPIVFGKVRLVTDLSMIASGGFVFVVAQPLVDLLYDDRYSGAGALLQILSFSLLFARISLAQQAYAAFGRPQYLGIVSAAAALALYACVPVALHLDGFRGAVIAIATREALVIPVIWILNSRCGLNNVKHEVIVFLAWPLGYVAGWLVVHLGMTFRDVIA